jgi:CheY-like chemotaxis protein
MDMNGPRARLLLVEDDAVVLLDERRMLVQGGYDVVSCRRGEDAVETAMNAPGIDMLITDVDLGPGIDGIEAAREIVGSKPMPVLILSSSDESELAKRAEGPAGCRYLKKGFSKADLLKAVEGALAD